MVKTIIASEVSKIVLIFKNTNPSLEGKFLFTRQSFFRGISFPEEDCYHSKPLLPTASVVYSKLGRLAPRDIQTVP